VSLHYYYYYDTLLPSFNVNAAAGAFELYTAAVSANLPDTKTLTNFYFVNTRFFRYEKGETARQILQRVAELDPPGRFLKIDGQGLWKDVETEKAFEKACQALREKKWFHPETKTVKKAQAKKRMIAQQKGSDDDAVAAENPADGEATDGPLIETTKSDEKKKPAPSQGLKPDHPNQHISPADLQKRVRSGSRISVFVKDKARYCPGRVIKRLSHRLLVLYDDESDVSHVDLNKDLIQIDSRKLILNLRLKDKPVVDEDDKVQPIKESNPVIDEPEKPPVKSSEKLVEV
jgi:hypothetical protein